MCDKLISKEVIDDMYIIYTYEHKYLGKYQMAYNMLEELIGSPNMAESLIYVWGIYPRKIDKEDKVCSIGFCTKEQRWYGWNEEHIMGYGVRDIVRETSIGNPWWSLKAKECYYEITSLEDAKQKAIEFVRGLKAG
jgi:hypothetical protein